MSASQEIAKIVKNRIQKYPETYDQTGWVRKGYKETSVIESISKLGLDSIHDLVECGGTACVAGHAVLVGLELDIVEVASTPNLFGFAPKVARDLLGLTLDQADWLFHCTRTLAEVISGLNSIIYERPFPTYSYMDSYTE